MKEYHIMKSKNGGIESILCYEDISCIERRGCVGSNHEYNIVFKNGAVLKGFVAHSLLHKYHDYLSSKFEKLEKESVLK